VIPPAPARPKAAAIVGTTTARMVVSPEARTGILLTPGEETEPALPSGIRLPAPSAFALTNATRHDLLPAANVLLFHAILAWPRSAAVEHASSQHCRPEAMTRAALRQKRRCP
jgi:hypothetical protein